MITYKQFVLPELCYSSETITGPGILFAVSKLFNLIRSISTVFYGFLYRYWYLTPTLVYTILRTKWSIRDGYMFEPKHTHTHSHTPSHISLITNLKGLERRPLSSSETQLVCSAIEQCNLPCGVVLRSGPANTQNALTADERRKRPYFEGNPTTTAWEWLSHSAWVV